MENPLGQAGRWSTNQRHRKTYHSTESLSDKQQIRNRDVWIERYLAYLDLEIDALSAGPIGLHYLHCARATYSEFIASGSQENRFRCWLAIRTCAQWLCQLRKAE